MLLCTNLQEHKYSSSISSLFACVQWCALTHIPQRQTLSLAAYLNATKCHSLWQTFSWKYIYIHISFYGPQGKPIYFSKELFSLKQSTCNLFVQKCSYYILKSLWLLALSEEYVILEQQSPLLKLRSKKIEKEMAQRRTFH